MRKGSGIIHGILVLPATELIVLSYLVFFHVKVFTAKLPDCNWNVKAPAGKIFLLLILLLHSFMWQFCCSLACRMHLHGTKKITPPSHPTCTVFTPCGPHSSCVLESLKTRSVVPHGHFSSAVKYPQISKQ